MLKLKKNRGLRKLLGRTSIMVVAIAIVGALGIVALRKVWADGEPTPTFTLTSVSQYGVLINAEHSDYIQNGEIDVWGRDYYPVANNTDEVLLGFRLSGLAEGKTYTLADGQQFTSADNDTIIYTFLTPYVFMDDSVWEEEETGDMHYNLTANEYQVSTYLEDGNNNYYYSPSIIVRPAVVGNSNFEIFSVKQDNVDVVLDTVGRQVQDPDVLQTINEYQLLDFTKPISIDCELKNLHVGWEYYGNIGGESFDFVAESETLRGTLEVNLNPVKKHTELYMNLSTYGPNNEHESMRVPLYFRIVDERFVPLGNVVIEGVSQGGVAKTPTIDDNTYTFRVNDIEDVTIDFHVTSASEDVTYYVGKNMWGNGGSYRPTEWSAISGADLLAGTSITIGARTDESESSPFLLSLGISMTEDNFNYVQVYYGEYDPERYYSDNIQFEFYVDDAIPRYTLAYGYANYPDEEESAYLGMVDARFHDENNPLKVRIDGTSYADDEEYEINIDVKRGEDDFYNESFTATGAQLNSGYTVVMEGLTLLAPTFDAEGEGASIWGLSGNSGYDFTIEVNGLKQSAYGVFYQYPGWANSMITYAGGSVNATPGRRGMGGSPYVSYGYSNISSSALDESKKATLHYLGEGFENDVTYNYALYFRGEYTDGGLIGDQKLDEGTISGEDLNSNALSIALQSPDENSGIMVYDLVIKKGNNLVIIARDEVEILNEPRIETFTIDNDAEDYTQTGKVSYTIAKDVDMVGTLTGANFDDETTYKLGVQYSIDAYDEEHGYWDYTELVDLREEIDVTGAELNSGFTHTVYYDERFAQEGVNGVEVYYYFPEHEDEYFGHAIYLRFVEPEAVQYTEGGFHIDENGEVQNDEHEPIGPGDVTFDDRTPGDVDVIREGTDLTIVSRKPTLVIGFEGGHYSLLEEMQSVDNDGEKTNSYDMSGYEEIKVVLKGDGDMDGAVTPADLNRLNRSQISPTLGSRYRALSDLEKIIFDFDGDGDTTPADLNTLNRALISPTLAPRYKEIQW